MARRHVRSGIETTMEAALARAEASDVNKNGEEVRERLIRPRPKVKGEERGWVPNSLDV